MSAAIEQKPLQMVDVVGQYRRYQDEIDSAVLAVLRSGAYINGPAVKDFERHAAEYLGVKHAIGCASGTDALQIALMAIGLQHGDEVITTPFTFAATTETIALLGGVPVYVDIDPDTYNIGIEAVERAITSRTKAILPVHLFGQPVELQAFRDVATRNGVALIEDAAQAMGAKRDGVNACALGDVSCISFYPSKNLGAFGDAGMMTTNDDAMAAALRSIANHGSPRTYYHERLGVNSRLDSIQAAILDVKLKYLDEWNAARRNAAAWYTERLLPHADKVRAPFVASNTEHIWHQYSVILPGDRGKVVEGLRARQIPCNIYYPVPLHLQEAYRQYGGAVGQFPHTEYASEHILALPMHSELMESDVEYIVEGLLEALSDS